MEFLKSLLKFFKNDIYVSISRDKIEFKGKRLTRSLEPYVVIGTQPSQIVLAVGEPYNGREGYQNIQILNQDSKLSEDCMSSFFKYGFWEVMKDGANFVRPTVYVSFISDDLQNQKERFSKHMIAAGAVEVNFLNGEKFKPPMFALRR